MKIKILAVLILLNIRVYSQSNSFVNLIDSIDLKKHISILASDSLEGRETGEIGQKRAANYIQNQFRTLDLQPCCNNDYFQKFPFYKSNPENVEIIINNKSIANFDQIIYEGKICIEKSEMEVMFVGEGSVLEMEGLDVKNKVLLLFTRKNLNRILFLKDKLKFHSILYVPCYSVKEFQQEFKSQLEFNKNAYDLLQERPANFVAPNLFDNYMKSMNNDSEIIFSISPLIAKEILNISCDTIKQFVISNQKNNSENKLKFIKCNKIGYNINILKHVYETENVIGLLKGESDNKFLLISAHYDHLGKHDNEIFHGADDNASGVAAMLEIIQSLSLAKSSGYRIPINIIFIATTGEEKGLWGSTYYTKNSIYSLENTIGNINLDMLGRIDNDATKSKDYLYIYQPQNEIYHLSKYFKDTLNFQFLIKNQSLSNFEIKASDQYSFIKQNIPGILITSGMHSDYHQTEDTCDKINYKLLERRTREILEGILKIIDSYKKLN